MNVSQKDAAPFGAHYLEDPDRFPDGLDGERWGRSEITLRIAGRSFAATGLSEAQRRTLLDLWPDFVVDDEADATRLSIFRTPVSTFRRFERWVYDMEFFYGSECVRMAGLDLMANLRLAGELHGAVWIATETPETFHGAFENFLRVVVAYSALELGGALLHSAAVVEGPTAWIFAGHSGAGKSTVSRIGLESGRTVLSDDLNPVLPASDGGLDVIGCPFYGDEGLRSPARHTLSGIYRLEQGPEDGVRPMQHAESIASLMACSPYINRDPHRSEALFENLSELTARVPSRVLTFRREGTFWPLLERSEDVKRSTRRPHAR